MLDSNIILGTGYNLGKDEPYKHAILTQNWESWPCAVPVVYPSGYDFDEMSPDSHIQTALLFSPNQHNGGRWTYNTPISMIQPVGFKPLFGNHKVLTVNEFDLGKWDRVREFIHDVGGISFVVEYEAGRRRLTKSVQSIEKLFKYSALFYYNGWGPQPLEGEDDKFVAVITLLDLPYCVPIFNMRKVDGIGLSFTAAPVASSVRNCILSRIFQADLVFTNYEDNVFVIDGAAVNVHRSTDKGIYAEMNEMCTQKLKIKKMPKGPTGLSASAKARIDAYAEPKQFGYGSGHKTKSGVISEEKYAEVKAKWTEDFNVFNASPSAEWKTQTLETGHITVDSEASNLVMPSEEVEPSDEPITEPEQPTEDVSVFGGPTSFVTTNDGTITTGDGSMNNIQWNTTSGPNNNDEDLPDDDDLWLDEQDPEGN